MIKVESYSINFSDCDWEFAFDNVHKDVKVNFAKKEVFSFDSNYVEDDLKVIKKNEKVKHITNRST